MFFSFDGIDGVGKSTQIERFVEYLRSLGHDTITCRDPGSTELGEAVREILLRDTATPIGVTSEMLLYMAARAQLVDQVIRPALQAKQTVVTDRFLLSNVAYQGYAGGLGPEAVWDVGRVATGGIQPDLYFVLDMPAEAAAARLKRDLDRMELRGNEYRERLRKGFLEEARQRPNQVVVIDAAGSVDEVHQRVLGAAHRMLERPG